MSLPYVTASKAEQISKEVTKEEFRAYIETILEMKKENKEDEE